MTFELRKISKNFQKSGQKLKIFDQKFQKTFIFSAVFIPGCFCNYLVDCPGFTDHQKLHKISSNSLLKTASKPPNRQKKFDQNGLLNCSYAKTTFLWPPLFSGGRQLLSWAAKVKSQLFRREQKKIQKVCKNHDFSKNFDFCDFWLLCAL